MRVARLVVLAAVVGGCKVTGTFQCETHDQCRLGGEIGVCELTGYCSFADPACDSGRRYDALAGGGLGGSCTTAEVIDAAIDTVDAFDPVASCPPTYDVMLAGSTSRYRVITTAATYWPHHASCVAEAPGITHPIVLQSMPEVTALQAQLTTLMVTRVYIGAVQDPMASGVAEGWINFDGSPLLSLWHPNETPPEPGDSSDGVENQEAQLALFDRVEQFFHDASGTSSYAIACECDGKPIAPVAQQFVDNDPNNPN